MRQLESQGVYRWTTALEETDLPTGVNELLGMTTQEITHLIEQLLGKLPARQQQILRMRFFRGLSLKEIQAETQETAPALRHLLYDGIEAMRKNAIGSYHRRAGKEGP